MTLRLWRNAQFWRARPPSVGAVTLRSGTRELASPSLTLQRFNGLTAHARFRIRVSAAELAGDEPMAQTLAWASLWVCQWV